MKSIKKLITLLSLFIALMQVSFAGDLDSTLGKLAEGVAKGYISPISSAFGANLNSGWMYRAAKAEKFGVDIDFGIVAMGTLFAGSNKKFYADASFQFDNATIDDLTSGLSPIGGFRQRIRDSLYGKGLTVSVNGPTIVGSKNDSIKIEYHGAQAKVPYPTLSDPHHDTTLNLFDVHQTLPVTGFLENLSVLPLAAPQASIGTIFGTKLSVRYLPSIEIDKKLGKFEYIVLEFSIIHLCGSLSQNRQLM